MAAEADDPRDGPAAPRRQSRLVGHEAAEAQLLHAFRSGKFHHGWLLAGPRGIGKATLAYRLARFLLAHPDPAGVQQAQSLYVDPDLPVSRRIVSGGHADLLVLERPWDEKNKRPKTEISAAGARACTEFFAKTAGEGGWRICIVDAADDLNLESSNAILKTLEEPPQRSLFILVAHRPGGLLPTIRSRCIRLDLKPLSEDQVIAVIGGIETGAAAGEIERAARMSGGSPGRALQLLQSPGAAVFAKLNEILATGRLDLPQRLRIADQFAGRQSGEDFEIFCTLLLDWTAAEARRRALAGRGDALALVHEQTSDSIRQTNALNLDRRQAVFEALDALRTALKAA